MRSPAQVRSVVAALAFSGLLGLSGCPESKPATTADAPKTNTPPKGSPIPFTVLSDEDNRNTNSVEYHILIAENPKHDDVDALLKFVYRHLMTRRDPAPIAVAAHVYSSEVQYKTPPRSPIASVTQKSGELGQNFDNRVPLEFWQQIDQALDHGDKGWKLEKKLTRDDANKTLTIQVPYTEPGKDQWADTLSYTMALNIFADTAKTLFEKVPELRSLTFVGQWKDEDVVKISLDRPLYQSLKLGEIEDKVGALHGQAYLEMSAGKNDAQVAKANAARLNALYKKMLTGLKGQAFVSPKLK